MLRPLFGLGNSGLLRLGKRRGSSGHKKPPGVNRTALDGWRQPDWFGGCTENPPKLKAANGKQVFSARHNKKARQDRS
jgi:hypothetical protein